MKTLRTQFKNYLLQQNLSPLSIKNYLADLNKFLNWFKNNLKPLSFSSANFQEYVQFLKERQISPASLTRYLSSLRQFGQFLVFSGKAKKNPAANLASTLLKSPGNNFTEIEELLAGFEKSLQQEKLSLVTIRNYLVDVRQFLNWYISK
jgi:site-specific recombinase XerD